MELGMVYDKVGKPDKARVQYDSVLSMINGDDIFTSHVAKMFTDNGRNDYAIKTYERALQMLGNPPMYGRQLAELYYAQGNLEMAIQSLLRGGPNVFTTAESAKEIMLEMLGNDPEKLRIAQKTLVKSINEQPGNNYYEELLTWIYTQKDDWEGALMQIEAINERNNENGHRLIAFARTALAAKQYEIAEQAYNDIVEKGPDGQNYLYARSERLAVMFTHLQNNHARTAEDIAKLIAAYDSFLTEHPEQYALRPAADEARLLAEYGNNVKRAIAILDTALARPETRHNMMGQFKLQLGDYYLLVGREWDASLEYSQVEKEFKQDVMGEDARFRNARLAYYQGDFELAQKLLGILKSGTSNLIANDAIDLSVLITENVEDSVTYPLERFAYAGLLLFQNKDKEAEALADSIAKAYPKHPLNDDIIMMKATIATKHRDFNAALAFLQQIVKNYGDDVLADDALYRIAEIYNDELANAEEARKYYEQLIIDFPGSTWVQTARQKLALLKAGSTQ